VAKATTPLGRTITAMRIYVDYNSVYTVSAVSVDIYVSMGSGSHLLVAQAWDNAGAVYKSSMTITVR
jgi:hypothetical protein